MKLSRLFSAFLPLSWLLCFTAPAVAPNLAAAQSACPYIITGAVLTAGQWNTCWTNKQDYSGAAIRGPSSATAGDVACWSSFLLLNDCGASTGTGAFVRSTSPTLVSPNLGAATASSMTLTAPLAIANGGSGQTSASAAFNALSPVTAAGDLIVGTGTNAAGRLAIGGSGTVLSSNGSAVSWQTAGAGTVTTTGSPVSGNVASFSGATAITPATTTGTGSVVLGTSPALTTPTITGVTDGSSAAAGKVGEYVCAKVTNGGSPSGCSTNSATPVAFASTATVTVTSISLTAGDWTVCGNVFLNPVGAGFTSVTAGISNVAATQPSSADLDGALTILNATFAGVGQVLPTGCKRFSTASTASQYLVASGNTTGSGTAWGIIWARRVR